MKPDRLDRMRVIIEEIREVQVRRPDNCSGAGSGEPRPAAACGGTGAGPTRGAIERLEAVSGQIRSAFIRDFETNQRPQVERVASLTRQGLPLPTLTVCGLGEREVAFTQYLAFILNPKKPHGLGWSCLEAAMTLFGASGEPSWPSDWRLTWTDTFAEHLIGTAIVNGGSRRCYADVVIAGKGWAVIIEHKIGAEEGIGQGTGELQLQDYDRALAGNPRWNGMALRRVFLRPSDLAPSSLLWTAISHLELVKTLVPVLQTASLTNWGVGNLRRFLVDILMGPAGVSEEDWIALENLAGRLLKEEHPSPGDMSRFGRYRRQIQLLLDILESGDVHQSV